MIDTDAAIARAFERFLREPVMLVMLCERLFQSRAENLELLLAHAATGTQQAGHEADGSGDLWHHLCPAAVAAAAAIPALDLAHGWLFKG